MSELSLRRRGGLPTSAADELRGEHRRTRWLRLALAAAAVGLLLGAFGLARDLHALPTSYFASGSGGIVVLDLSTSVDAQKSQRVMRVLQSLSETEGRIGLVVFSDSAYEMLPPDTRSEELRPLLRFFDQGPVGLGRPRGFGGGSGGGLPSRFSRIHAPRVTGDVRFATEVTSRKLPCPNSPLRARLGTVTRRKSVP